MTLRDLYPLLRSLKIIEETVNDIDLDKEHPENLEPPALLVAMKVILEFIKDNDSSKFENIDEDLQELLNAVADLHSSCVSVDSGINYLEALERVQARLNTKMPREVLLNLASIEPIEHHDDNGPGIVMCPTCSGYIHMQWKNGQRLDEASDIAHDSDCPATWARGQLEKEA